MSDSAALLEQLRRDGHVRSPGARLTPLAGGVSSDIYLVEDGRERFVVKRALPRLRVADEWFADVRRNLVEREYLECIRRLCPDAVPRVFFAKPDAGYFGMEHLGAGFQNWKQLLLAGQFEPAHAARAGHVLGEIHRRTAGNEDLRRRFDTTDSFHQLRTAPYLLRAAERHPELGERIAAEAARLEAARECLVHGDFSPKNLLIGEGRLVVLDAEVAWYGDPAFDVAFLLNHLLLKRLRHAPRGEELADLIFAFWRAYRAARSEVGGELAGRVAGLLPWLLLARVDGKSPVEYLDPARQEFVRQFVRVRAAGRVEGLEPLIAGWFETTARFNSASAPAAPAAVAQSLHED
jgi:aminoglycoside phosphotransferase (APT) family kinase protein